MVESPTTLSMLPHTFLFSSSDSGTHSLGHINRYRYFLIHIQSVSKKLVFSGKTAITAFKLIQNVKSGGVLENSGYFYIMGTEIFKIEEKMPEKMKPEVANPPSKNQQNSLLTLCTSLMILCISMTYNESKTSSTHWLKVK